MLEFIEFFSVRFIVQFFVESIHYMIVTHKVDHRIRSTDRLCRAQISFFSFFIFGMGNLLGLSKNWENCLQGNYLHKSEKYTKMSTKLMKKLRPRSGKIFQILLDLCAF